MTGQSEEVVGLDEEIDHEGLTDEELALIAGEDSTEEGDPDDKVEQEEGEESPENDGDDVEDDGGEEDEDGNSGNKKSLLARFKAVYQRQKDYAKRIQELEQERDSRAQEGNQEHEAFDIDGAESEFASAIMDGDADKAQELRRKINAELLRKAEERAENRLTERQLMGLAESAASKVLEDYPVLNIDSEYGNAQAVDEVREWRDFFMAKGFPMHEALVKAAGKVAPFYIDKKEQENPVADAGFERKKDAIKRNARAANAQPPLPAGVGDRSREMKVDVETMSEDDWEGLSESERNKMLGITTA